MSRVEIVPIRFARGASERLPKRITEYYKATAEWLLGEPCEIVGSKSLLTVPLGVEAMVNADLVYRMLADRQEPDPAALLIIDMGLSSEPTLPTHHVIAGIMRALIVPRATGPDTKVLMLLPVMLAEADVVMEALQPFIVSGSLTLLAADGSSKGLERFPGREATQHVGRLAEIIRPPVYLLRDKLVRFPGHFVRRTSGPGSHCNEFFFDARFCQSELIGLLEGYVSDHTAGWSEPVCLFYHSTVSGWLERAMSALSERRGVQAVNLENLGERAHAEGAKILLILPLVDTGDTVAALWKRLSTPPWAPSVVRVLSVLSTEGEAEVFGQRDCGGVAVDYLLRVQQVRHSEGFCPMCEANLKASDPSNPDPSLQLTAQAFWALAEDVGLGRERDVPEYREPIGFLPQFRKLDHRNAAYLAYKVHKLLSVSGALSAAPVFIFPEEEGSRELGDALQSVFNMTVIRVPKAVADKAPKVDFDLDALLKIAGYSGTAPGWAVGLRSLQEQQRIFAAGRLIFDQPARAVIVADELRVSGRSHNLLGALIEGLGLRISAYFSVLEVGSPPRARESPLSLTLYNLAAIGEA